MFFIRVYNIDVIFVFDGKPGEKYEEIKQRREDRHNKWVIYDELIKKDNLTLEEKKVI